MTMQADYFAYRWRHNAVAWLWAGLLALGMNLALFNLIPNLLHPASPLLVFDSLVPQINVIRIKRPERPVKRKTPKPLEPEVKKREKLPQPTLRRTPGRKLSLAFETNTKLPGGPAVLELPPMVQPDLGGLNVRSVFSVGELDQPLVTLARVPPVYPSRAKRRGIQGWVKVKFVVNEQGRVEDLSVVKAQPPGVFDDSVRRCVSGWRFRPGTIGGAPVKVWAETTIRFELD
jgi:protein TonB